MDEASGTQLKSAPRAARVNPNSDFTELARLVKSAGLMRRRYGYYWTKLIVVPMSVAAAIAAFIWIGDSWWQMFTAAVFAFLFTQTAFLGHDDELRPVVAVAPAHEPGGFHEPRQIGEVAVGVRASGRCGRLQSCPGCLVHEAVLPARAAPTERRESVHR